VDKKKWTEEQIREELHSHLKSPAKDRSPIYRPQNEGNNFRGKFGKFVDPKNPKSEIIWNEYTYAGASRLGDALDTLLLDNKGQDLAIHDFINNLSGVEKDLLFIDTPSSEERSLFVDPVFFLVLAVEHGFSFHPMEFYGYEEKWQDRAKAAGLDYIHTQIKIEELEKEITELKDSDGDAKQEILDKIKSLKKTSETIERVKRGYDGLDEAYAKAKKEFPKSETLKTESDPQPKQTTTESTPQELNKPSGNDRGQPKFPYEDALKRAIKSVCKKKPKPTKKIMPYLPDIIYAFAPGKEMDITEDVTEAEYKRITRYALSTIKVRVRRYYK